jgi:dTDP-glucose 4,6-dehydratase
VGAALAGRAIPVYGDGGNVRDWLHVEDHCRALDLVCREGEPGGHYLVGGENLWRNIDLVEAICGILDKEHPSGRPEGYRSLIRFVDDRPGHDRGYSVDSSHIRTTLGWRPEVPFDEGLRGTIRWYLRNLHRQSTDSPIVPEQQ